MRALIAKTWVPAKYPAIPHYNQYEMRDPHDYKLRSKEELRAEHEKTPPDFTVVVDYTYYPMYTEELKDHNDAVRSLIVSYEFNSRSN